METLQAIDALAALSQATRLEVFRLLVRHAPHGLPAGTVAEALGVPANTLSAHLSVLGRAGLVESQRHGRSIVYRANLDRLREVVLFLLKDCCGGRQELCAPLIADLVPCCPAEEPADGRPL
ncbi:transcriptional regulator, ArsR family, ArsR2 [Rhodovulum sp. PH10]|uniref:ArsR/SmtB family transcription factor n=1 Tax=Rhodovulum sp. PH10 TaxID=1187851 RepID=UPI00027C2486|nr:metalloregulator ArsR/SmtB family transcription factor [Rhodovulum sp. PH10]EJW13060.1 transcriptional regulator, ArsR family, ArsR2 [Rhodovulum sp. PH10]